jgi:hypothetical protein
MAIHDVGSRLRTSPDDYEEDLDEFHILNDEKLPDGIWQETDEFFSGRKHKRLLILRSLLFRFRREAYRCEEPSGCDHHSDACIPFQGYKRQGSYRPEVPPLNTLFDGSNYSSRFWLDSWELTGRSS